MIADAIVRFGPMRAKLQYSSIILRALRSRREWIRPAPVASRGCEAPYRLWQDIERIRVTFATPGLSIDSLMVEVTTDTLRVAPRGFTEPDRWSPFEEQVLRLPETVDPETAEAKLENGVLTVELTKLAWRRGSARRVPINQETHSAGTPHPEQHQNETDR